MRLRIAPALEHSATLGTELQHFQLKTVPLDSSAFEWREQPQDNLDLAVAVAAWQAERHSPVFFFEVVVADPPPGPKWLSRW
jgi:hypothetical protein